MKNSMMWKALVCSCSLSCLFIAHSSSAQIAGREKVEPPLLTPLPLWNDEHGAASALKAGRYLYFDPKQRDFVIAYSSALGEGNQSDITVRHITWHGRAYVTVETVVSKDQQRQLTYQFKLHNSSHSDRALAQFVVYAAGASQSLQITHPRWTSHQDESSRIHLLPSHMELRRVGWRSQAGQSLQSSSDESEFTIHTDCLPGFTYASARSQEENELTTADLEALPEPVKLQIKQLLTSALDESIMMVIGPAIAPDSAGSERVLNFRFGINHLIHAKELDSNSPFVLEMQKFLDSNGNSGSEKQASSVDSSNLLGLAKSPLEKQIAVAVSITFGVQKP